MEKTYVTGVLFVTDSWLNGSSLIQRLQLASEMTPREIVLASVSFPGGYGKTADIEWMDTSDCTETKQFDKVIILGELFD